MERRLVVSHHRPERVADQIRAELARMLAEEVRDPRIGFVTVTAVELSPDMRNARVFVSVLGDEPEASLRALRRATSFLKRGIARRAGLRFTPELRFAIDDSISGGFRIEKLLGEIRDARPGDGSPREPDDSPPGEPADDFDSGGS
jgi:ribosome-binding factor A